MLKHIPNQVDLARFDDRSLQKIARNLRLMAGTGMSVRPDLTAAIDNEIRRRASHAAPAMKITIREEPNREGEFKTHAVPLPSGDDGRSDVSREPR